MTAQRKRRGDRCGLCGLRRDAPRHSGGPAYYVFEEGGGLEYMPARKRELRAALKKGAKT